MGQDASAYGKLCAPEATDADQMADQTPVSDYMNGQSGLITYSRRGGPQDWELGIGARYQTVDPGYESN